MGSGLRLRNSTVEGFRSAVQHARKPPLKSIIDRIKAFFITQAQKELDKLNNIETGMAKKMFTNRANNPCITYANFIAVTTTLNDTYSGSARLEFRDANTFDAHKKAVTLIIKNKGQDVKIHTVTLHEAQLNILGHGEANPEITPLKLMLAVQSKEIYDANDPTYLKRMFGEQTNADMPRHLGKTKFLPWSIDHNEKQQYFIGYIVMVLNSSNYKCPLGDMLADSTKQQYNNSVIFETLADIAQKTLLERADEKAKGLFIQDLEKAFETSLNAAKDKAKFMKLKNALINQMRLKLGIPAPQQQKATNRPTAQNTQQTNQDAATSSRKPPASVTVKPPTEQMGKKICGTPRDVLIHMKFEKNTVSKLSSVIANVLLNLNKENTITDFLEQIKQDAYVYYLQACLKKQNTGQKRQQFEAAWEQLRVKATNGRKLLLLLHTDTIKQHVSNEENRKVMLELGKVMLKFKEYIKMFN